MQALSYKDSLHPCHYYHLHTTSVSLPTVVCISCQELTSTLREGNHTCPGEEVTFTCIDSLGLAWSSREYIDDSNPLQFTIENSVGQISQSVINGSVTATAELTNRNVNEGVLVSTLHIIAVEASTVTCHGASGSASIEFSVTGTYTLQYI